ncbi:MAG TPA: hypothetical protein VGQ78_06540 [Vicinamibacteria bacterium]|nr:hypothetical protein [Vicinamibacteria bacterium]
MGSEHPALHRLPFAALSTQQEVPHGLANDLGSVRPAARSTGTAGGTPASDPVDPLQEPLVY